MRRLPAMATGALAAGVLLTGCGDSSTTSDANDIDALNEALLSAQNMAWQIEELRGRLIVDCMVDAGFDVHPPGITESPATYLGDDEPGLIGSSPTELYDFPTADEARENGVGMGITLAEDYVPPPQGDTPPDAPFYDMPEKYLDEYSLALSGDDETDFESGRGCVGEVEEALLATTGHEVGTPMYPKSLDAYAQENFYQSEALTDAQDNWSQCMNDLGHPYFDFRSNTVDLYSYAATFYREYDPDQYSAIDNDPPPGAPWDHDEAFAKEIELAVDASECADETRLRESMQSAWDAAIETMVLDNETIIFVYHDEVEQALEAAQKLLTE